MGKQPENPNQNKGVLRLGTNPADLDRAATGKRPSEVDHDQKVFSLKTAKGS